MDNARGRRALLKTEERTLATGLFPQPPSPGLQRVDVVEDDFYGGGDGDGEDHAYSSPEPPPEQERHGDGERVELQAVAEEFWVEHIQREEVQSGDGDEQGEQVLGGQLADAHRERRNHGQHDPEVGNQAEESAEGADQQEEGQLQQTEDHHADDRHEYADQQVAHHEAADHVGNESQGDVGSVAMLHGEQHHGGRAGVLLPAQHEVDEEGNKADREHELGERSEAVGQQLGDRAGGLNAD